MNTYTKEYLDSIDIKVDDLEIGESKQIGNTKNKIKRIGENEFLFQRFDTVKTHLDDYTNTHNLGNIHANIVKKLDYELEYAEDRIELVENLVKDNPWIYDLISTNKMISKEIKKKSSFLAEDQQYDKLIDSINTYITHAKFINKEDELQFEELQKEKLKLEKKDKRKKTREEFDELNKLINTIQSFHHKQTKAVLELDSKLDSTGELHVRERVGDFVVQEELKARTKNAKFKYKKEEIPEVYWEKMYPTERKELIPFHDQDLFNENKNQSELHLDFRPQVLLQMKEEIERLHEYLGLHIKDKQKRNEHIQQLKDKLEMLMMKNWVEKNGEGIKYINGDRQYAILRNSYTDLKADYEVTKKILTDEFYFNPAKHSTVYEINSDTWYEDENGKLVELSKNRVSMSDANTYKGLILNYKDLKDKYSDKSDSDWWALIKDFENILDKVELSEEEWFLLDVLFDGYSQKQIEKMYKELELADWSQRKISRLINEQIPNKLLNTYLRLIDDFVYTYKIKGKFKRCNKCGEVKLISNNRYFTKNSSSKDGFYSICNTCR